MRKRINPDDVKAGTLVRVIDQFSSRVPIGSVGLVIEWVRPMPIKNRGSLTALVEAQGREHGFFGHCTLLIKGKKFNSTAEFLLDSCELVDDDEEMPTL